MNIQDRVFIVTGGASGLGAATAKVLVEAGGKVIIADMNDELGPKTAAELGDSAKFVETNVTEEDAVQAAVDAATGTFGRLDGAINCAGVGSAMRTISKAGPCPFDAFKAVIDINLIGTFNVIRLSAFAMTQNEPNDDGERGVIINTASVAAFDGQIGQAAYSASKAGIVGMTLPIARDLSSLGIRVVTIAPGLFDTPLLAALPEENRMALGASVPFPKRLGKPSEYASLAKQIIENPMMNGETIRLDGAIRMPPK